MQTKFFIITTFVLKTKQRCLRLFADIIFSKEGQTLFFPLYWLKSKQKRSPAGKKMNMTYFKQWKSFNNSFRFKRGFVQLRVSRKNKKESLLINCGSKFYTLYIIIINNLLLLLLSLIKTFTNIDSSLFNPFFYLKDKKFVFRNKIGPE